jgi:16S rRNA (guanine(966)-N(2))-methyltransferase RsmD
MGNGDWRVLCGAISHSPFTIANWLFTIASMLRIIAGEYRSRKLLSPDDATVSRPYTDRVKETVFNLLRGWFEGARVLDLFAGVGTMGLEAVSRGASRVVMVEKNRAIFDLLKENIAALGCEDRATAVMADAMGPAALTQIPRPVDVIFIDPPFHMMEDERSRRRVLEQIERCRTLMGQTGFVVLRSPIGSKDADFSIAGFDGPEDHRYSSEMHVLLYSPKKDA